MMCCVDCFEHEDVRVLVQRYGSSQGGPCAYCGGTTGPFADVDSLSPVFRRLVGHFYCSVSDLSQAAHIDPVEDGELLHNLVSGDFSVFANTDYRKLLFDILNAGSYGKSSERYYDPYDLYASREDDWLHWPLDDYWDALKLLVRQYGHSFRRSRTTPHSPQDLCGILQEQLEGIGTGLEVSTPFWRARRGAGHTGPTLGAPPPHLAAAGRGNIQGQPVLYLCTEQDTAIHEIRPSIGDTVSVARFQLRRPVRVCDLRPRLEPTSPFVESEEEFDEYLKARARNTGKQILGRELSKPVRRDDEAREYLPTQVLVQLIAEAGFDGVAYDSSQRPGGSNFLFFAPDIASQVEATEEIAIKGVNYTF